MIVRTVSSPTTIVYAEPISFFLLLLTKTSKAQYRWHWATSYLPFNSVSAGKINNHIDRQKSTLFSRNIFFPLC